MFRFERLYDYTSNKSLFLSSEMQQLGVNTKTEQTMLLMLKD